MKLFVPQPATLITRIQITRQGEKAYYINLCETTKDEVATFVKKTISTLNLSIFETGRSTCIVIREYQPEPIRSSISISFKGLSPKETHDLIIKTIKEQ